MLYHAFVVWRTKAFWIRAVLCWMVGAALLVNDELAGFDTRMQVRGPKPALAQIVLIDLNERDWLSLNQGNLLRPMKEVANLTDAAFWNPKIWGDLLSGILEKKPASIGITFFFGENIRLPPQGSSVYALNRAAFEDPRVIWGADVDSGGRVLIPLFASNYNSNVGLRAMRPDDDGIVRRFSSAAAQVPDFALRVSETAQPERAITLQAKYQHPTLINYSGPAESFKVFSFKDVLDGRIAKADIENKIVIIGSLNSTADRFQTPIGRMSRVEIIANTVDNIVGRKSITRLPTELYLFLLALLMASSIWVLITYPQSVGLVFFILVGILWTALSISAFDVLHIWLPILSPLVQLTLTYILFLSYRLALNEQRTWRLQQEQRYLSEIEQLKTNFVSMMSHDLKTPIAKIQAICDRLLSSAHDPHLANDLKTLRRSSDDLHRYIQSILQVTRVEAKDFKINKEVTDINENIERVVQLLMPLAAEKNIRLTTKLEPMFSIEADTTLLEEVILNLAENAIKYTPSGGSITITSDEFDEQVRVEVSDDGPGIPLEEQSEIWGKFIRGQNQQADHKGTGLGLYLVKYFVELHGGRVFLSSTVGIGTKIGFIIPIAPLGAETANPVSLNNDQAV
jgi:two-component system phosphate regulon sensor histidine kinase PhoR